MPHGDRPADDARQSRGVDRLHRLPRRRCGREAAGGERVPRREGGGVLRGDVQGARAAAARARVGLALGANPERSYTLLNRARPEVIRFMNPGDYRVARDTCGKCHMQIVQAAERSLMATGSMFWNGAAYNNGLLPFKRGVLGESYTRDGRPAAVRGPGAPDPKRGILAE